MSIIFDDKLHGGWVDSILWLPGALHVPQLKFYVFHMPIASSVHIQSVMCRTVFAITLNMKFMSTSRKWHYYISLKLYRQIKITVSQSVF